MQIYYEIEDLTRFEADFKKQLHKDLNSFKQKIHGNNEYAKGICSGLSLADKVFICAFSKLCDGDNQ